MRRTGITRKMDDLGRIVIPKEIRDSLGIKPDDYLYIDVNGTKIIMERATESCSLCGGTGGLLPYKDGFLCADCVREVRGE